MTHSAVEILRRSTSRSLLGTLVAGTLLLSCGGREPTDAPQTLAQAAAPLTADQRKVTLKAGTSLEFDTTASGTIDPIIIEVKITCTGFKGIAHTTSSSDVLSFKKPPTISGCTSTYGPGSTAVASGTWKLKVAGTGKLDLVIPKDGLTFPGSTDTCGLVASPDGSTSLTGTYDSTGTWVGTDTIKSQSLGVKGAACSVADPPTYSPLIVSGTFELSE